MRGLFNRFANFMQGRYGTDKRNSTQSALLSLSVPYLPCIKLANLLNNPRIKFILSAKSGNYKNHPSTILSQAGRTFNKHLTIYVTKSAENELCRVNAFFCVTAVVVSADFHSVVPFVRPQIAFRLSQRAEKCNC